MKMPTTTNVKVEPKVSPEMGADATKQCISCLEKKVRNLEKRKSRIEQNQEKAKKGTKLEKEQEVSLHQYEQVTHDLEFARELHKQFQQIYSEHEKMAKKQAKREKVERQTQEIKRVGEILQVQSMLDLLGGDKVREDFKTGKHGAVVLSEDNLNQLDELYQAISPSREESGYSQRLTTAAEHLVAILDGKDRQVVGTTYKEIKELIDLISGCGYFENLSSEAEPVEAGAETVEGDEETCEEDVPAPVTDAATSEADQEDDASEEQQEPATNEQQPIDLTVGAAEVTQSQDIPSQHPNTMEQDAFFGPSSTAYQVESEPQFQQSHTAASSSTPSQQVPDFQSFTNNRPFQFIQTSYIMPEVGADPAVIAAQPPGASSLQFISQNYESSAGQQQKQQPQQQSDMAQGGQQTVQQPVQTQQQQTQSQDYNSQTFSQSGLHQQTDSRYQPGPTGGLPVDEVASGSLPSHASTTAAANMIGESSVLGSHSPYEIPPSIPMPPSQLQDQNQHDQAQQRQQQQKKFQMNASAPVFQSLYTQQVSGGPGQGMPVSVPPPTVPPSSVTVDQLSSGQVGMPGDFANVQGPPPPSTQSNGDYGSQSGGAGDFQHVYQGNGFSGGFSRGGRGGFRGRGGSGGNGGNRNGGPGNGMQNGFNRGAGGPGGANAGGRGGRGGSYQGYQPNAGYRSDGFQGGYNNGGNGGGFGNQVFNKRGGGGMGGAGGQGGPGYNRGGAGNMNRGGTGGMRGGMPRGGGQGAPRGAPRSQFNRPAAAQ